MNKFRSIVFFLGMAMMFYQCNNEELNLPSNDLIMEMRWIPSHNDETINDAISGLKWALSFLGADLPRTADNAINRNSVTTLRVNFSQLGFNDQAMNALEELIDFLKFSEEYEQNGNVTIGRFIALTINSSYHYYKITGAYNTLSEFKLNNEFNELKAAIIPSAISKGDRLIHIGKAADPELMVFMAEEGSGSIKDNTYQSEEHEVIDIMSNGQLRFAIYDDQGNLTPYSDSSLTISGKIAKCLWCHETHLLPSFESTEDIPGYMNGTDFADLIESRMTTLSNYRMTLSSLIDFDKEADHELMEILYISFMEPSAQVLATEWNISVEEVQQILSSFDTHDHHEFLFLKDLYNRYEIDPFAPYQSIQIPGDAREASDYEPNLIR